MLIFAIGCAAQKEVRTLGSIERKTSAFDGILSKDASIEILGEGYQWSEGPVWVEDHKMLLFSDVPANTVYKWTEAGGVEVFLSPSGYTGEEPSASREPGSNGLVLDPAGNLVLCQHGDRRLARLNSDYNSPTPAFTTVADNYQGKRFNSPNDAVYHSNGELYFTDPPYGLPQQENDPTKELPFHGVYKVSTDGTVTLLVDSLTRPNGLAFTPDEKALIIANSDPMKAAWYVYDVGPDGMLSNGRIFYDATAYTTEPGLPDGLKTDRHGNVFASGPGGIWIFDAAANVIGKITLPEATANCALADDDKTLFITSRQYLLRIKMR